MQHNVIIDNSAESNRNMQQNAKSQSQISIEHDETRMMIVSWNLYEKASKTGSTKVIELKPNRARTKEGNF